MTNEDERPLPRKVSVPLNKTLTEEPVRETPDVPGEKPDTYRFTDWALI